MKNINAKHMFNMPPGYIFMYNPENNKIRVLKNQLKIQLRNVDDTEFNYSTIMSYISWVVATFKYDDSYIDNFREWFQVVNNPKAKTDDMYAELKELSQWDMELKHVIYAQH